MPSHSKRSCTRALFTQHSAAHRLNTGAEGLPCGLHYCKITNKLLVNSISLWQEEEDGEGKHSPQEQIAEQELVLLLTLFSKTSPARVFLYVTSHPQLNVPIPTTLQ